MPVNQCDWHMGNSEASPCDSCAQSASCSEKLHACAEYRSYLGKSKSKKPAKAERKPTRAIYIKLFGSPIERKIYSHGVTL